MGGGEREAADSCVTACPPLPHPAQSRIHTPPPASSETNPQRLPVASYLQRVPGPWALCGSVNLPFPLCCQGVGKPSGTVGALPGTKAFLGPHFLFVAKGFSLLDLP